MPLGTEVGLGPGNIVLDGAHLPPPKKVTRPQLWAYVGLYCGQTVAHLSYCRALLIIIDESITARIVNLDSGTACLIQLMFAC